MPLTDLERRMLDVLRALKASGSLHVCHRDDSNAAVEAKRDALAILREAAVIERTVAKPALVG